jgi:Fe-S oxidoreductase
LAEGRLATSAAVERVIYHEPCYLGRHNGEYEAPRALVRAVSTDAPLEFELNRERAMCCGAGGGRMWLEETIGTRMNVARVEQALARRPRIIATGCPYCAVMMGDGLKTLGREEDVKVQDIAELVAASLPA